MLAVIELSCGDNPFTVTGVPHGSKLIPHYDRLADTLLNVLAEQVNNRLNSEVIVELDGDLMIL